RRHERRQGRRAGRASRQSRLLGAGVGRLRSRDGEGRLQDLADRRARRDRRGLRSDPAEHPFARDARRRRARARRALDRPAGDLALVLYPSPNLYDGRGANKAWLQELPDPTTKVVWGSWVELHPITAKKFGIEAGKPVQVTTDAGSIELPAYVWEGVRPDVAA